jgi:hypothetical protein
MFEKATTEQLKTIFYYEREQCSPVMYKAVTKELIRRGELDMTIFQKATTEQLWVILKYDPWVRTEHLLGIIRELIRRNEYKSYIEQLIEKQFKSIFSAERATHFSYEELLFLCYQYAFHAVFEFEQGHGSFLNYYEFLVANNLKALSYWHRNNKEAVL